LLGPAFAEQDKNTWGLDNSASSLDLESFCKTVPGTSVRECTMGSDRPSYVIALVGDSHAAQYRTALLELAKSKNWQIVTYVKGACTPSLPMFISAIEEEMRSSCQTWKSEVVNVVAT